VQLAEQVSPTTLDYIVQSDSVAAVPASAYLMASVITVFSEYPGDSQGMTYASEYWALAFVYLAIGVGIAYFIMGWSSNTLSVVRGNLNTLECTTG